MKWDTHLWYPIFFEVIIDDVSICRYNKYRKEVMLCYNLI